MTHAASELDRFIEDLKATGLEHRAKRTGDAAPDVTLPDALGREVRLSQLWRKGPLIVLFYRGGWCPYCNTELRTWQQHLSSIRAMGTQIVAISLETPDNSLRTAQKNSLAFPVLSDVRLEAANGFDIAFSLAPELVDLYGAGNATQPILNASGQWVLPIPATFVVDCAGAIQLADVDVDFRRRALPPQVLEVAAHALKSSPCLGQGDDRRGAVQA